MNDKQQAATGPTIVSNSSQVESTIENPFFQGMHDDYVMTFY